MFDRKAVRFFRKDLHNWRKKADGKTVRETHEKLKVDLALLCCSVHVMVFDSTLSKWSFSLCRLAMLTCLTVTMLMLTGRTVFRSVAPFSVPSVA